MGRSESLWPSGAAASGVLVQPIAALFGLCLVMAAAWAWQRYTRNIGWVDVFWTFGAAAAAVGLSLAWATPAGSGLRRLLVCGLASAWALRLGLFIGLRVARTPEDGRYQALRQAWGDQLQPRLFGFLQLQALVGAALAVAMALAANRPDQGLRLQDLVGLVMALAAICGEAEADRQLQAFKRDPANRGRVCDQGLWAWSRHPNYLFEWLGWFAYPAMAVDLGGAYPEGWATLAAPALMFVVLRFGTGVPPLEAHMRQSRGAAYGAYQRRVPVFLPRPPRDLEPSTP